MLCLRAVQSDVPVVKQLFAAPQPSLSRHLVQAIMGLLLGFALSILIVSVLCSVRRHRIRRVTGQVAGMRSFNEARGLGRSQSDSTRPGARSARAGNLQRTSSWPLRARRDSEPLPPYSPRQECAPCAQAGPSRGPPTMNAHPPPYVSVIELAPVPPAYHSGEPPLGPSLQ